MYDIVLLFGGASAFSFLVIVGFLTVVYWAFPRSRIFRVWGKNEPNAGNGLSAGNLSKELTQVTEWYKLGINLGIQPHELNNIDKQYYADLYRKKMETLDLWLQQTPNASWVNVVNALQDMGKNVLAKRIRDKYIREAIVQEDDRAVGKRTRQEDSCAIAVVQQSRQKINGKFGALLKDSCKKLREKQIDMKDFCRFLEGLFPPGDCIPESSSIDEIFKVISRNKLWDHWNYSPLQEIIQEFVGDEMKSQIESYKKDLASYKASTKLVDYIDAINSDPSGVDLPLEEEELVEQPAKYDPRYYRKLSVRLETRFTNHTLKYLDDLWKEFADLYNLPPLTTLLDCVYKSSISIVWLIPSHLAPHITPCSVDFYLKHRITRVEFDGVCIYEKPPERGLPRALPALEESVKEGTQHQSREFQAPPQLLQGQGFHIVTYNILSYLDDARSLCRAEQVCNDWYQVICKGLLWKKLIEKKVKTDSVWRGLSERRGWSQYLFHQTPSEEVTHQFYKQLCTNVIRDIDILQFNWMKGHYTLTRIQCHSKKDQGGVWCLQCDDNKIVSGHNDSTIKIWDRKSLSVTTELRGHSDPVECLQYDDRVIITGSRDLTIRVWDVNDGSLVNTLDHHGDVISLRFNSDTLVTGFADHTVAVWDMFSPMDIFLRKVLKGHMGTVRAVDFDDKYIVSGSADKTIKVWQTSTGELVHTLHGHRNWIRCLQYRGKHIVSGSYDRTIRIWDIESGACMRVLEGHSGIVLSIRFDDRRIVSGDIRGGIKVWNIQAALDPRSQADTLCLQTLREHSDPVYGLQFDDFQIVSGSYDDSILIWDFLDAVPPAN